MESDGQRHVPQQMRPAGKAEEDPGKVTQVKGREPFFFLSPCCLTLTRDGWPCGPEFDLCSTSVVTGSLSLTSGQEATEADLGWRKRQERSRYPRKGVHELPLVPACWLGTPLPRPLSFLDFFPGTAVDAKDGDEIGGAPMDSGSNN
jgi:hypothetical protein